jgi:hypothetical protein
MARGLLLIVDWGFNRPSLRQGAAGAVYFEPGGVFFRDDFKGRRAYANKHLRHNSDVDLPHRLLVLFVSCGHRPAPRLNQGQKNSSQAKKLTSTACVTAQRLSSDDPQFSSIDAPHRGSRLTEPDLVCSDGPVGSLGRVLT